jgi:hypothetical protein
MNAFQQAISTRVQQKLLASYRKGLQDGTEITLKLILGREQFDAQPAPQPLPEPLREWAERALERAAADRAEND